jgi:hypothetical protein
METVTLRGEDFKTLHNTLCDLRNLVERMEQSMIKTSEFDRIIEGFQMGLKDAYEQDNSSFDRKHDYYGRFREENSLTTIWSVYELQEHGFLRDHPFQGAQQLCYRDHWGDEPVFEPIEGRTWGDLYRAADRAIRRSGDDHHIFIEAFHANEQCPEQLFLITGS